MGVLRALWTAKQAPEKATAPRPLAKRVGIVTVALLEGAAGRLSVGGVRPRYSSYFTLAARSEAN